MLSKLLVIEQQCIHSVSFP